jgi:hypothetical protein
MNDARIKSLRQRRYREVNESQQERNQNRVDHASSILSELEEQVGDDNGRKKGGDESLSVQNRITRRISRTGVNRYGWEKV